MVTDSGQLWIAALQFSNMTINQLFRPFVTKCSNKKNYKTKKSPVKKRRLMHPIAQQLSGMSFSPQNTRQSSGV